MRKLSLGCPHLDRCLAGGIDHSGITEIAGEAGAGKTQLVLQLLLRVQLPHALGGLGGGAIFLHSDAPSYMPAMSRLRSLAATFANQHRKYGATSDRLMDNVAVMQVDHPDDLEEILRTAVPSHLRVKQVRLIVLDSIAALYRTHLDESMGRAEQHGTRAQQLFGLAARLKRLSDEFNVAVVVTNQVTDKPLDAAAAVSVAPWERSACGLPDGGGMRVPALGTAWAHCSNTRLLLTRHAVWLGEGGLDSETRQTQTLRQLHVAWSPRLPNRSAHFEVREEGIVGTGDGALGVR